MCLPSTLMNPEHSSRQHIDKKKNREKSWRNKKKKKITTVGERKKMALKKLPISQSNQVISSRKRPYVGSLVYNFLVNFCSFRISPRDVDDDVDETRFINPSPRQRQRRPNESIKSMIWRVEESFPDSHLHVIHVILFSINQTSFDTV